MGKSYCVHFKMKCLWSDIINKMYWKMVGDVGIETRGK